MLVVNHDAPNHLGIPVVGPRKPNRGHYTIPIQNPMSILNMALICIVLTVAHMMPVGELKVCLDLQSTQHSGLYPKSKGLWAITVVTWKFLVGSLSWRPDVLALNLRFGG